MPMHTYLIGRFSDGQWAAVSPCGANPGTAGKRREKLFPTRGGELSLSMWG